MINRVRQLYSALTARVTPAEMEFVRGLLTEEEFKLFSSMDLADQRHCIDVAGTCLKLLESEPRAADRRLLVKAALLHDVGKQAGDLKLWDRVTVVLMRRFYPSLFHRLALKPYSPFQVSLNHPQIGKDKCAAIGCPEELARLVGLHHTGGQGVELEILLAADKIN